MKLRADGLSVSPTDLAYFLSCRHRTALEMAEAHGGRARPEWKDPLLEALFALGLEHEKQYVARLERTSTSVVNLGDIRDRDDALAQTREAMRRGVDVIVQAALAEGRWYGRPDILRRVERASPRLGAWSYEIADTKLARETRGGTILQLGLYSELLEMEQGLAPESFSVVVPGDDDGCDTQLVRRYRVAEYAAYFRLIKTRFEAAVARGHQALFDEHYPDPVDHCEICAWAPQCRDRRRADDHLSLVAGISRMQRRTLEPLGIVTVEALAAIGDPMPLTPARGAIETYERVRDQAAVQIRTRREGRVAFELIPIPPAITIDPASSRAPDPTGLARLPGPSPGDVFLDLEGDPLAGDAGREYLFGLATVEPDGSIRYEAFWADDAPAERRAFEHVVDLIAARLAGDPGAHVYHYAPYEPSAFKRLMGRYSTRQREIDQLLRGRRFVDLYAVIRQGVRVGVERYSIKNLEPLYAFARAVDLRDASRALRTMEQAFELDRLDLATAAVRRTVEAYNRDDCLSTLRLRDWLEVRRAELVAQGREIPRPVNPPGDAAAHIDDRARDVEALRDQLLTGVGEDLSSASDRDAAHFRLAYLLDYHRREDKAFWWDYFRLCELPEEDLFDEPAALAGLEFAGEVGTTARSVLHRYRFPPQEMEIRRRMKLKTQDGRDFGEVFEIDRDRRTIDLKIGKRRLERPTALINQEFVTAAAMETALLELGTRVASAGGVDRLDPCAAQSLLLRLPPRGVARDPDEGVPAFAERVATTLDRTVLPIQGPPGSGKTCNGARMICALVAAGRKVGVSGPSHKVIRNLLDAVVTAARDRRLKVAIGHKDKSDDASSEIVDDATDGGVVSFPENATALEAIASGRIQVLGGTAWLWARPEFANTVDVLFVDEAGQMSLANTLAIAGAADSLVLLGDPQQLEQPTKGSHPEGVGVSALQHVLGDAPTMPADRGLFLPLTWRLAPAICAFTSEQFYDGQLHSKPGLERQALTGTAGFDGAGLWLATVPHDGNTNAAEEEVAAVVELTRTLLTADARWLSEDGSEPLAEDDLLIVAPFNAQVARIKDALGPRFRVGTVDKFQGQEAPIVIYSMTTSRPEDAPRGLGFLFSRNRLNVATSRARCAVILVASPWLFEAECVTPRQMRLANALCRFRELAKPVPATGETRATAEPEPQRLFE